MSGQNRPGLGRKGRRIWGQMQQMNNDKFLMLAQRIRGISREHQPLPKWVIVALKKTLVRTFESPLKATNSCMNLCDLTDLTKVKRDHWLYEQKESYEGGSSVKLWRMYILVLLSILPGSGLLASDLVSLLFLYFCIFFAFVFFSFYVLLYFFAFMFFCIFAFLYFIIIWCTGTSPFQCR